MNGVKVGKPLSKIFDDAEVRLVSLMPAWIPGQVDGRNVNMKMYFSIEYFIAKIDN
jgi:hypothetical protein